MRAKAKPCEGRGEALAGHAERVAEGDADERRGGAVFKTSGSRKRRQIVCEGECFVALELAESEAEKSAGEVCAAAYGEGGGEELVDGGTFVDRELARIRTI